ncbi:MAG TPA: BrnT family toxin [Thermoanaerobaculia bacterium]
MVTWDEDKRQANLRKHGLDFEGCEAVFDHPVLTQEDSRRDYGEQRINLLGWLWGQVVHMTYTERGEDLHVISLREATRHETRYYFEAVSNEA